MKLFHQSIPRTLFGSSVPTPLLKSAGRRVAERVAQAFSCAHADEGREAIQAGISTHRECAGEVTHMDNRYFLGPRREYFSAIRLTVSTSSTSTRI